MIDVHERMRRARVSLEGLSVADAFGQQYFFNDGVLEAIEKRQVFAPPWFWTDDTAMALSIYDCLCAHGAIDADDLAKRFARRYHQDHARGYGGSMHDTLRKIQAGEPWQLVTTQSFDGMGSYGNGAAMRVAPIGAYYADDLERVVLEAERSARVTHAHPEATAGAIAVAVAAALATHWQHAGLNERKFFEAIIENTPASEVRSKIEIAAAFNDKTTLEHAVVTLGCGWYVSAQDTVPLCIWLASKNMSDYTEAMWSTVAALGDRDTTCAIVGSIVACNTGPDGIDKMWLQRREALPLEEPT